MRSREIYIILTITNNEGKNPHTSVLFQVELHKDCLRKKAETSCHRRRNNELLYNESLGRASRRHRENKGHDFQHSQGNVESWALLCNCNPG